MSTSSPVAFFSYVRAVDDHDGGKLSDFRKRLEGEVSAQTGKPFPIFQDRNDIAWGQQWKERILDSINISTFLIPIITPSFFNSPTCREEFEAFLRREATLGSRELILPVYYIAADIIEKASDDAIATAIRERNWIDWREYRFKNLMDAEVCVALARAASSIKDRLSATEEIKAAAKASIAKKTSEQRSSEQTRIAAPALSGAEVPQAIFHGDPPTAQLPDAPYYAFTRRYDETIRASKLAKVSEIAELQARLAGYVDSLSSQFAGELETLQAYLQGRITKGEVLVTLLVDNSGSLRGEPIKAVAAGVQLACEVLDACGVMTEVLGFTTKMWKGGLSRELWLAAGKPKNPGRLNDLRHIIYKSSKDSLRRSSAYLALMLREGILKENIDGEAILWAFQRQDEISARRKILVVLSDGAPVDDSTMAVNPINLLSLHLRSAIDWVSKQRTTTLLGIGIKHSLSSEYEYSQATSLHRIAVTVLEAVSAHLENGT